MNMERIKQFGDSWEERKEGMYKNMEKKADIIKGIFTFGEELTIDDTPEKVKSCITEWYNNAFNSFNEKNQEEGTRLIDITSELIPLREKYDFYYSQMTEDQQFEWELEDKYPENLKDIVDLDKKIRELHEQNANISNENPDAIFLKSIHNMSETLVKKNELVRGIKEKGGAPFRKPWVVDIKYDAFDIFVITDGEKDPAFAEEPTKYGFHVSYSPVSFIRSGSHEKGSVQHERIHNFIDPVKENYDLGMKPERMFEVRLRRYERLKEINVPDHILENEKKLFLKGARSAVNNLREELLAHLEIAEENSRPGSDYRREVISEKDEKKNNPSAQFLELIYGSSFTHTIEFKHATRFYSTAGRNVVGATNQLNKLSNEYPEEKELLYNAYRIVVTNFTNFFNAAREILAVTREMGEEQYKEAHALFFLINPSDTDRIKDFIKQKYSGSVWNSSLQAAKKKGVL